MTAPAEPLERALVSNLRHYRYYDLVMAGFVTVLVSLRNDHGALRNPHARRSGGALQCCDPACPGGRLREHGADRRRVDDRLLVWRLREQLCHGEDEGLDRGASPLDAHDRLDRGRPACQQYPFYPIAFLGTWQPGTMMKVIAFDWAFKVSVKILFTPMTYAIVRWLKHRENEDWYDRHTNFTPFSLKD